MEYSKRLDSLYFLSLDMGYVFYCSLGHKRNSYGIGVASYIFYKTIVSNNPDLVWIITKTSICRTHQK